MQNDKRDFVLYMFVFVITLVFAGLVFYLQINYQHRVGGDFTLNLGEKSWVLSKQSKKLNLLYFGYTKCPDVCPLSMSYVSQVFKSLDKSELKDIQFLFVNLDYEHDRPETVMTYVTQFYPDFIGLSGSLEQLEKVLNLYETSFLVEKNPKSYLGYSIAHADRIFFIDKNGILIDSLASPRSTDEIIKKIKEHL